MMTEAIRLRSPGISRGFLFDSMLFRACLASAAVAFGLTALLLHRGFAGYDDGAYAWAMEHMWAGARLHSEIPWGHPGYVLWILLPFRDFLAGDIVHYRAFLPPLAALTAAACVSLGDLRRLPLACLGGAAVATLGFAQFATYSASWFGIAFTAASLACAHRAATARLPSHWWLAAGALAGLAFGFRGPNGVLAAAGAVAVVALADPVPRDFARAWTHVTVASLFAILALAIITLVDSAERALFAFPLIACLMATARHVWVCTPQVGPAFAWIATGFFLALTPLFAATLLQGSTLAMLRDIVLIPAQIADAGTRFRTNGVLDMASLTFDLLRAPPSMARLGNLAIFLVTALAPLWLTLRWLRHERPTPPLLLATLACLSLLLLPGILYAPHAWPFLALLVLSEPGVGVRGMLAITVACLATVLVTPRGLLPGSHDWFMHPDRIEATPCPLPRCSLVADGRSMKYYADSVRAIRRSVPATQALIVLPTTASMAYFLPNPAPFTLTWPDMRGDPRATAEFRQAFIAGRDVVVAMEAEQATSYSTVAEGLCLAGNEAGWMFFHACPETVQPVAFPLPQVGVESSRGP